MFATLSCFLEIEAYKSTSKHGFLYKLVGMEQNNYENVDGFVSWPLINIKEMLRIPRLRNRNPAIGIVFFINQLHNEAKKNSLFTFEAHSKVIQSFPILPQPIARDPKQEQNLMETLVQKYLSASKATFNFMKIIRVRKVYYKCFCHEETFTTVPITELDDF